MKTCEWCESITEELVEYQGSKICKACSDSVNHSKCRKCGSTYPDVLMLRGLCLTCLQVEETERARKREEVKIGVDDYETVCAETEFTEEDYEKWMVYDPNSKGFKPKDFKESAFLRRLWIMTKLNAVGIVDEKIINENIADIEDLITSNFSKLLYNKCRFYIINNMADRKKTAGMTCIAHKNKVFIMQVI